MHVQAAGADGVAAGQRDVGRAAPGEQRAEHADRGPHPAHEVVVGLGGPGSSGTSIVTVPPSVGPAGRAPTVAAEPAQQLGHDRDVEDVRDVGDRRARPGASSAAAISFSTVFLAPATRTSPASRVPPVTRNASTGRHRTATGADARGRAGASGSRGAVGCATWSTSPASTPAPATTARPPSAT